MTLLADTSLELARWQFALTATDANRFSIRLARHVTGRPKVLVFNWCYHGSVDETFATLDGGHVVARRGNLGPPVPPAETTKVVEWNDLDALEAALCHGWIDGQKQAHDSEAWLQKFTPRGARSIWSKINREKAEQLIASGRMMPAGLRAIENAKRNGRWENAYHSAKGSTIPEDFLVAMAKNRKAKTFFETLNSANRYAILFRIQTAKKAETRARRIEQFIRMLARHEKIHP